MNKYAFNQGMPYCWLPPKILLIMKLIIVMMTTCLMQVTAATFAQKLTYSKKGASLEEIFKEIKKQTGYNVLYSPEKVDDTKKIDVYFKEAALPEVLEKVVSGQALEYTINDKNISLKPKESTFLERLANRWASIDASGRVVDSENRPLPGASVKVKKTGKGVSTDKDGRFFLRGVEEGAVLVVSFIGYLPKEVNASTNMGNIVLEQSLSKLDEVQVIAYGTTTQRLSTGNVTTIKADVIEKQPVNNPLLALQGRVPGLFIEQATGFAGTGVKVRIQGTNSLANGNEPLYVVDGIPFPSQLIGGTGNNILNGSGVEGFTSSNGSPLNYLNPSDIESIDILKDADATAIYGSRAANGAILITTKKGKAGEIRVNANLQAGLGKVGRRLDLMNRDQYLEMRNEALKNGGLTTPRSTDYDLNGVWDNSHETDWQRELIGGTAKYRDLQTSVSGGNATTTFLVGAMYHKEGNVFPGNYENQKNSVHFNINSTSNNQRFKLQLSGSYLKDNNSLPQVDLTSSAMTLAPVAPSLFNAEGGLNWQPGPGFVSTFTSNPMQYIYSKFNNKTSNLIANSTLSYQILPGFEVKSNFGYNNIGSKIISYKTSKAMIPEYGIYRTSDFADIRMESWSVEPQLTYTKIVQKHKIDLLLGMTIQQKNQDATTINGGGFGSDQIMEDIKSATVLTPLSSINSRYKYHAVFARVNYNWQDKYILNLTGRRDGSSRFGSENRFHNFGAMGAAWIFSQEQLFARHFSFLSYGKLRASYGITGNDQIPDYQFLNLYDAVSATVPYQGAIGYRPTGLTNPFLQWEETRKLQFGLDLGFLKDRILFSGNYNRNLSSNQLQFFALPITTGFLGAQTNFPAKVENTGWELTLSSKNINKRSFQWSSSFNLTVPKNKLLEYPGYDFSGSYSEYLLGQSVNIHQFYHFLGIDPANSAYNFKSRSGNTITTINDPSNRYILINPDPKFYGGFQNTFVYKGIQLDVLFQFTKQTGRDYFLGPNPAGLFVAGANNQPVWQLDRWQKPGDEKNYPKYISSGSTLFYRNIKSNSDAVWSDASYIKLKNLSLSCQLPQKWKSAAHLSSCKLYVQGQNLLTITNYKGLDPESKSSLSLPPLRVITIGVQVGL